MVETSGAFYKTEGFDDRLNEVSRRIEELDLRQRATPIGQAHMNVATS